MRRPMFLFGAVALLLVGSSTWSSQAWSHDTAEGCYNHKHGWYERVSHEGTVIHVTNPTVMQVDRVEGGGNIIIEADGNPNWNPSEWRCVGSTILAGWPNGWGGYETCVYTLRTSEPGCVAWVHFDN